ncbi:TPA: DUF3768 domain-containing protein [Pseudomonas aeruginosa]
MDREKIKTLVQQKNDNFRKNILYLAAKVNRYHLNITPAVGFEASKDESFVYRIIEAVANGSFNDDNDPHLEHDFNFFTFEGERYFWKIDYFADERLDRHPGEENLLNDEKCFRVLTIGEAAEY